MPFRRDVAKVAAAGLAAAVLVGAVIGHLLDRIIRQGD